MRHRNYWAKVNDTADLVKIVLSRIIEKLCVVCIQEPAVLFESNKRSNGSKENQPQSKGNRKLGEVPLVIRIHKKLELIKSKIPDLPCFPCLELAQRPYYCISSASSGGNSSRYQEGGHAGTRQTQVSEWFSQRLRIRLHQNTTAHEKKLDGTFQGISFGFWQIQISDKLAVEMDKIYAKIQNLSIDRPTAVNPQGQSRNPTERIPRQPTTQEPDLASFGDDVHAMIARLLTDDQNLRVIPIMGMQGIGKTTLANFIFNHKAVVDHFPLLLGRQMAMDFSYVTRRIDAVRSKTWYSQRARMKLQKMLQKGTSRIRRLVDHLDKEDISFDHIHGDYNTTSTSLTPYYENVLSFLSFDTRKESKPGEEVETFFVKAYPAAIGKLTRLRYLGLRSTFLEVLPSSISKLQNVQTLDMKHTSINTLPDSIWKLQQLRQLYLSESYRSKLMLRHGTNFPAYLQTLCGLFVDEETPVRDGLDRLKSIDQNNQPWDLELKPLVSLVNLSYIYLLGRLRNPSIMSQFPHSLIDLTLSGSGLVGDPMQSLDKLPNLRSLKLLANSYLGKNMLCSSGGFPQLRVLKVWNLEQLEEWNVEKGALQALRDLEIRVCRSLKILPAELLHRTLLKIEVIPAQ
ncbi:hypothetical protein AAG906_012509 [Vitis piasezkii]